MVSDFSLLLQSKFPLLTNLVPNMESMHNNPQDQSTQESNLDAQTAAFDLLSKAQHQRRFQRGLKWMGGGALTLVLSFAINFLCFQCAVDFHTPMYVLTSLGALACLKGMMDIF